MQVNDDVTFTLLKRPRDSIIPAEVHPPPDPNTTPSQDNKSSGMETSHTSWGTDKGHKEGTYGQGGKSAKGDRSKDARHRSDKQGHKASDEYGGTTFNKYAKFTRVGDGKAFWKAAAEELASYAAQVFNLLLCMLRCAIVLPCYATHSAALCCGVLCYAAL